MAPTSPADATPEDLEGLRERLLRVVRERGYEYRAEPFELASGEQNHHFIDGKAALARGRDLQLACRTMLAIADDIGTDFDAVGGLTLGADQFAHAIAVIADRSWFVVRKRAKGRGTNRTIEGTRLDEATRVLLVDDVISTGGSIARALEDVTATGATVVLATALVDRGDVAGKLFADHGIPYRPVFTYHDLGIPPITGG